MSGKAIHKIQSSPDRNCICVQPITIQHYTWKPKYNKHPLTTKRIYIGIYPLFLNQHEELIKNEGLSIDEFWEKYRVSAGDCFEGYICHYTDMFYIPTSRIIIKQ